MDIKAVNITIYGQVQGVGFRYYLKSIAQQERVGGFARNQADGSVYIEAEGTPLAVDSFLAQCKKGPSSAQIKDVYVVPGQVKNYADFRIAL
ncbi:MAG: acylphosphatase [Parcubacteria group bacterium]|nr:MAG: acylphosphatase [Parcubacteria group bacterium]